MSERLRFPTPHHGRTLREHERGDSVTIDPSEFPHNESSLAQANEINATRIYYGYTLECEVEFYAESPLDRSHNILYLWNNNYLFLLAKKAIDNTWELGDIMVEDSHSEPVPAAMRNQYVYDIATILTNRSTPDA